MKTIGIGTSVKMIHLDRYGFEGREFHPSVDDLDNGYRGVIVDVVEVVTAEETGENEDTVCFRVCDRNGTVLDLMNHEICESTPVQSTRIPELIAFEYTEIKNGAVA